jgi:dipeptidyl-peptidase-4
MFSRLPPASWRAALIPAALALSLLSAAAQDRLKTHPAYSRFDTVSREANTSVKGGALAVSWKDDGAAFEFSQGGKRFRYDIAARTTNEVKGGAKPEPAPKTETTRRARVADRNVARGRQSTWEVSPDGKWRALYRDRNVWLGDTNGSNAVAVTTDGNEKTRVKFGSASWVYGEEVYQNTAMWWSSNGARLAFYRFDESRVPDYFLTLDETRIQNRLDVEPYAKTGATNPVVDILVYDLATKKTVAVDVRGGQPFDDHVVGHYVYGVSWTPDSRELVFHRTNRRQNVMELCAADPDTGRVRVIVREEWLQSWTENLPTFRYLEDGRRFIWSSERTGWNNYYLYDLSGALIATLTDHAFEVAGIVRVDEKRGHLFYTARDGDNPMKLQLHRVGLDGRGDVRLTDPKFHHSVDVAPDGRHFIDIVQTHDTPPFTRLVEVGGRVVTDLARSDTSKFKKLGLRPVELLKFKAADGVTDLYGMLHKPSNFNSWKKYPLLVSVYAGPATTGARETFTIPNALTELGFLVATFDSRTASGRGKIFLDSIYMKLGTVEVADQAAGVRSLHDRWCVDKKRVGIFGTSYGGTTSALALLQHPGVFHAASASSSVTDFRNYDTIYTERYMWLPRENKAGYDAVVAARYLTNLTGRLMLFYGTADDNVHPANTLQLVAALQRAGKSFELQVGPDRGHESLGRDRMMEFFIENLR